MAQSAWAQNPGDDQTSSSAGAQTEPPAGAAKARKGAVPVPTRAAGSFTSRSGQTYKATLDASETLFSLMAALNYCGYDQELASSDPLRAEIRADVERGVAASDEAKSAAAQFCSFTRDHQQGDPAHDLAQYISLALLTGEPPQFEPVVRESDLPPDAGFVLGALPLVRNFYRAVKLGDIWRKRAPEYDQLVQRFHDRVAAMILSTDVYLRLQFSGYLGRRYIIYVAPLVAPGAVNARNYGDDYFLVVSPTAGGELPMAALRHMYLHYVLDQYAMNHGTSLNRLRPLQAALMTAPMDESFKEDPSLFATECLIRAIEARMIPGRGDAVEHERRERVRAAMAEGFTLAQYFYDALIKFEKGPAGLKDSYDEWIYQISVPEEIKRARNTEFAAQASPELLAASKAHAPSLLDSAERKLMNNDPKGAAQLARQALDQQDPDTGRALFVLARAAAASGDMPGAMNYFERTLNTAREPRITAWSHIYLGRIFDLREERDRAVAEYRAALAAGDTTPDTKRAAERGLAHPYAPPAARPQPATGPAPPATATQDPH